MSKTQIFVQQADGTAREVEIASGGVLLLNTDEHLLIAASSDQAQVETGAPGEVIINLEGVGEFTVESAQEIPEQIAMAPEIIGIKPLPTIVFEPTRTDLSDDAPTHEPLGVHQARVDSTAFLDRQTGDDFGMGQLLDMAEFSGMAGEGLAGREGADDDGLTYVMWEGVKDDQTGQSETVVTEDGVVEITGTAGHDNLTTAWDFDDPQYTFHVRGLERNDTLRGGVNADTLDGGADWDTVDYSASTGGVRIDLNVQDGVTAQSGGGDGSHAEGDVLTGIELVVGTKYDDVFIGDTVANVFYDLGGRDYIDGGYGLNMPDHVDYSASTNWLNIDLNVQDGVTAQSGGGDGNHAEGDTLKGIERVTGSDHPDVLIGNNANNFLFGGDGDDTMRGDDGTAFAPTYQNFDSMYGGDGDDYMVGGNGRGGDELFGGSGKDTLYGGRGIDTLYGGADDDYLYGGAEDGTTSYGHQDTLLGGSGNDTLVASMGTGGESNKLIGGPGADLLIGDGGATWTYYDYPDKTGESSPEQNINGVYIDLNIQDGRAQTDPRGFTTEAVGDVLIGITHVAGSTGMDTILGDAQNNKFMGLDGNDLLRGGVGQDELDGGNGNDTLEGGTSWDLLQGGDDFDMASYKNASQGVRIDLQYELQTGAGEEDGDIIVYCEGIIGSKYNDTLIANGYVNKLEGRGGDDILAGLFDGDTLDGGAGNDTADYSVSPTCVYVDLNQQGEGATQSGGGLNNHALGDVLIGIENVIGTSGNDTLLGNDGDNTFTDLGGADSIDGRSGQDMVDYSASETWVHVDLTKQDGTTAQSGGGEGNYAEGDTLQGIDNLIGSKDAAHGDVLIGHGGYNLIVGLDGNDTILAGAYNDTLRGGDGEDFLDGGWHLDDVDYSDSTSWVRVDLRLQDGTTAQSGGDEGNYAEGDTLLGIENLIGSDHNDVLMGNDIDNYIFGRGGRDTIYGGSDTDTLDGGDGDDYIVGCNPDGSSDLGGDFFIGSYGNDTLVTGQHSNMFYNSIMLGGAGADRIIGTGVGCMVSYQYSGSYLDQASSLTVAQSFYIDLNVQDGYSCLRGGTEGNDALGDVITGIMEAEGGLRLGYSGDTLIAADDISCLLHGQAGNNLLIGGGRGDTIYGGENYDTLEGGGGADSLVGHRGFDMVSYEHASQGVNIDLQSMDWMSGAVQTGAGEENGDVIAYCDGIIGSNFNDTLIATNISFLNFITAHNRLEGLGGDDILAGLYGGDTLDGGDGNDTADYHLSPTSVRVALFEQTPQYGGGAGNHADGDVFISIENVIGSSGNDALMGSAADNTIAGLAGADFMDGRTGTDTVDYSASGGGVRIELNIQDGVTAQSGGEAGNHSDGDILFSFENVIGSAHSDSILGNAEDNLIAGGAGADTLDGQGGVNTVDYSTSGGGVNIDLNFQDGVTAQSGGEAGNHSDGDILKSFQHVIGSAHSDSILGNAEGNLIAGGAGADTLDGQGGVNTVDYHTSAAGVRIDLSIQDGATAQSGGEALNHADGDILQNFRDVIGSAHNDTLIGDGNGNVLRGLDGDDLFAGLGGADTIQGGSGVNTVDYSASIAAVRIDLGIQNGTTGQSGGEAGNHAEGDILTGIQDVIGTAGNDTIIGDGRDNLLIGLAGADRIDGAGGVNTVDYSASIAAVRIDLGIQDGTTGQSGGEAGNHAEGDILTGIQDVIGTARNDTLLGNGEDNTLTGLAGADLIDGQGGVNTVDYHLSAAGVYVDLNQQDGTTAQTGDEAGNHADGDILQNVQNVIGTDHTDTLIGDGTDNVLAGLAGADRIDGGAGVNTVDYSASTGGVRIDLNVQDGVHAQLAGKAGNHSDGDILTNIQNVIGSSREDFICGDDNDNVLYGMAGNDMLIGGGGNDTLYGGDGVDHLYGYSGDDVLHLSLNTAGLLDGAGTILPVKIGLLDGGSGVDSLVLDSHVGNGVTLDLHALVVSERITGIEHIDIAGGVGDANTLTLKASDVLGTTGGTDTLWVRGDGNDTVTTTDKGWTHVGVEIGADGQQYNHYSGYAGSTLVNLMIDADLANQNVMHA